MAEGIIGRANRGRKGNQTLSIKLAQHLPRGHILEIDFAVGPISATAQFLRKTRPMPITMIGNQLVDERDINC